MENAVDALKTAFAVIVFVIALSITIMLFSQAKTSAETVFYMNDKTNFQEQISEADINTARAKGGRIVGIETVIPTLYSYFIELYVVRILDTDGVTIIKKLDLNQEIESLAPWRGTKEDIKKNLDAYIRGATVTFNDTSVSYVGQGLLEVYGNRKFLETFSQKEKTSTENVLGVTQSPTDDAQAGAATTKITTYLEITYTLQP